MSPENLRDESISYNQIRHIFVFSNCENGCFFVNFYKKIKIADLKGRIPFKFFLALIWGYFSIWSHFRPYLGPCANYFKFWKKHFFKKMRVIFRKWVYPHLVPIFHILNTHLVRSSRAQHDGESSPISISLTYLNHKCNTQIVFEKINFFEFYRI